MSVPIERIAEVAVVVSDLERSIAAQVRAYRMAGSNSFSNGSFPNFACRSAQARGAPGTVIGHQPRFGMLVWPAARMAAAEVAAGARPDPLMPCKLLPSQTSEKTSPPMPLEHGSTTVSAMPVAIAASTALPPCWSIERPACAASGWHTHLFHI